MEALTKLVSQTDREELQRLIFSMQQQLFLNSKHKAKEYNYNFDRDQPLMTDKARYSWDFKPSKEIENAPQRTACWSRMTIATSLMDPNLEYSQIPDINIEEISDLNICVNIQ